ncbi:MAG: hypothetical protein FWD49_07260 [Firmicutes bacterium]|nr:hypothetical protein [Bacillota bacterium]
MSVQTYVKNKAFVDIILCNDKHTAETEEIKSYIVDIEVTKTQSCPYVFRGGMLTYCTHIHNKVGIPIPNLKFYDILDNGVEYVLDSFRVNDSPATPDIDGKEISYYINELPPNDTITICFKVKVL